MNEVTFEEVVLPLDDPQAQRIIAGIDSMIDGIKTGDQVPTFLVPECCREGWESCPHVVRSKREPVRRNVGL